MNKKIVYLLFIFMTAVSLTACGGGDSFDGAIGEPPVEEPPVEPPVEEPPVEPPVEEPPVEPPVEEPVATSVEDFSNGREVYEANCGFCHGNLEESEVRLSSAEQITSAISNVPQMSFLQLNDEELGLLEYVLNNLAPDNPDQGLVADQPPLVARLVKDQYINTVEDILGVSLTDEEKSLLPDELANERSFVTVFDAQPLQDQHILAYANIARNIAERIDIAEMAENFASCSGVNNGCRNTFVARAGLRFFRRPLTEDETSDYRGLFSEIANSDGGNFIYAASAILRSMLQAPQFVYRTESEISGNVEVTDVSGYELASRLSYFIWQSAPDEELLEFASQIDSSQLNENDLEAQIDRLLDDPKAERSVDTFWGDYSLSSTSSITDASQQQANELRRSVLETLKRNSGYNGTAIPLQSLFSIRDMVLTPNLAEDLGLSSNGNGYRSYDVSSLPERVGFLSHPGYLANIGTTSFVGRGTVMTERILCRDIPDVPPSLGDEIDEAAADTEGFTPRDASDFRFNQGGSCEGCHSSFEPIAFAFEQFDTLGAHSTQDENERELFSNGYILETDTVTETPYEDVAGLMSWLEQSPESSACFASNMLLFATGRGFAKDDDMAISNAHDSYLAGGGTYPDLIKAVAMNSLFRRIQLVTE